MKRVQLIGMALATALSLTLAACGGDDDESTTERAEAPSTIPQPTLAQLEAAGLADLPLAPESERVDIEAPTFSNPTEVTNPLFPVSDLRSVVFSGVVENKPFHTETTLLPETRIIEWSEGQQVEALISQYVAFIDGRIEELALDYYAQADDGSVWYLGEDVTDFNADGLSDGTAGTWLAGRDGPPEMIMPADPQVGDVHRAENIPAIAFEEVAIKTTDKTVPGPLGPVEGAIVGRELHDDGTYSNKVFAPGYGEFFTAHGGEIEALALAVPTDASSDPVPPELEALSTEAVATLDAVEAGDWAAAAAGAKRIGESWRSLRETELPVRLARETDRATRTLANSIAGRDEADAGIAAIDVGQSALDLELRHLPPEEIDRARFELWNRQVLVHAAAGDMGGVNGDVTMLELTRDRFAHALDPADLTTLDVHIDALRDTVVEVDIEAAADEAAALERSLAGIG
jgi:hypothetical protein